MAEKTPYQLELDEKKVVWDSINSRFNGYISASVSYGLAATRSAFLLNGGILFALPAYVSATRGDASTIVTSNITWAAGCYVVGVLFAALVCLVAYLNFQWHAHNVEMERLTEFSKIEEGYDETYAHRLRESRERYREQLNKITASLEGRINLTAKLGVACALCSYIAFIAGCFFAARAMLLPAN
ncbi:MAG: hypothetical protein ACT6RL_14965 [Neoaquamicrobium sediminum]|uniref:hypothetical protein n=1 Tax=Hyphomicrobiales TaxID=356 RepID=UPI0040350465